MAKRKIVIKKNCGATISDTCGSITPLTCTKYEGDLPVGSEYDDDSCITGVEIIEDIITILDEHTEQLDFTEFDTQCLEAEASDVDEGITLKDVITDIITEVCDIKDRLKEGCNETCTDCEDGCEEEGCCNVMEYYDSSSDTVTVTSAMAAFTAVYPTIKHKTLKGGKYKATIDLRINTLPTTPGSTFFIGISQDGLIPDTSIFTQEEIKVGGYRETVHFVFKVLPKTEITLMFKDGTGSDVAITGIKVMIEKV